MQKSHQSQCFAKILAKLIVIGDFLFCGISLDQERVAG
ncbi:hypothetical protein LROSRS0_2177 [Furfurilactobacillus rossiae]|nr:hypothetical protein LROSRS0_2177 [Furfurilactobacillus rossiae]QLE64945.1 hypothetical protein LROSL1_2144 [Furfurilactobacillus rossiae]